MEDMDMKDIEDMEDVDMNTDMDMDLDINFSWTWTFTWTSPANNDSTTTFTVHGNAVNGNNAQTGDAWATLETVVPGVQYEGDLSPEEGIDGVSQTDRLVLVAGLLLILGLLWSVARP